jgi:hypothetical protein
MILCILLGAECFWFYTTVYCGCHRPGHIMSRVNVCMFGGATKLLGFISVADVSAQHTKKHIHTHARARALSLSVFSLAEMKTIGFWIHCLCCLCLPFHHLNKLTVSYKSSYQSLGIEGYTNTVLGDFQQSVVTTWRTHEFVRRERR